MHTRRTLRLDGKSWDIALNDVGGIDVISGAAATSQNVANECRLFRDDAYFIKERGIPRFVFELGQRLNLAVSRSYMRKAAFSVSDVNEIQSINFTEFDPETRVLSGDIQFKTVEDSDGTIRTDF